MTAEAFDSLRAAITSLEAIAFLPVLLWLTWFGNGAKFRLPGWVMTFAWVTAGFAALRGSVVMWEWVSA